MAAARRTKAPASRVYYSTAPAPRQQRLRSSAQSVKPRLTAPSKSLKRRQSTLTQLDFAQTEDDPDSDRSDSDRSDEGACAEGERPEEDSDEECEQPRIKRRRLRKVLSASERKRQQTLTQMDDFLVREDNDEYCSPGGDDVTSRVEQRRTDNADFPSPAATPGQMFDIWTSKHEQQSPPIAKGRHNGTSQHAKSVVGTPSRLRTPSRGFKTEIPSSQSPATTPLHAQQSQTPSKLQHRTPLSEIHVNVLASRDLATASAERSKGKKKPVKPTAGSEDEECFSDNENYLPDSDDASDDEVAADSPTKARKHKTFVKPPLPRPFSLTPSRLRAQNAVARSSSSPYAPAEQTIRTSQASTVEFASPQSKQQRSPYHSRWTPSPRVGSQPLRTSSTLPTSPAALRRNDSFMSSQVDSQYPESIMGDITQVHSINDSADIVTASQMMRSSP